MTRNQARLLEETMQRSVGESFASGPSSASTGATSSGAWYRKDKIAADADALQISGSGISGFGVLTGYASIDTGSVQHGGHKEKEVEMAGSTDEDRARAKELGLVASSSPGFFDSSQGTSQGLSNIVDNSLQNDKIHATTSSSFRTPSNRKQHFDIVIDNGPEPSSSRLAATSDTPGRDLETPLAKKMGKESKASRKGSVAASEISLDETREKSTVDARPRRSTAAPNNYTPPWNADGTVIESAKKQDKEEKESSGRKSSRGRKSSVNASSSSRKGYQVEEAIVIDDDDDDGEEGQVQSVSAKRASEELSSAVPLDKDEVSTSRQVDDDAEKTDSDEKAVVRGGKKPVRSKVKGKKSKVIANDDEDETQVQPSASRLAPRSAKGKGAKGRKGKSRLNDSDDDEDEQENETAEDSQIRQPEEKMDDIEATPDVESPIKRGRGGRKPTKKEAKAKSKVIEVVQAIEQEEKKADEEEETEGKGNEGDEEDEVIPSKSGGSMDKASVLADASSTVNAGLVGKEKKDAKKSSNSSSSSSKSTIVAKFDKFAGKPLGSILSSKPRVPGLIKRKIAPLLTQLNEPPPKRKAIPIPKSKRPKEEEVDSDEERARANETPEQRMARYIQEMGEEGY